MAFRRPGWAAAGQTGGAGAPKGRREVRTIRTSVDRSSILDDESLARLTSQSPSIAFLRDLAHVSDRALHTFDARMDALERIYTELFEAQQQRGTTPAVART